MKRFIFMLMALFIAISCFGQEDGLLRGEYPGAKLIPSEGGYYVAFRMPGNKIGIARCDETLTIFVPPIFDNMYNENFHLHNNSIRVGKNGKWGIVDASRSTLPSMQPIVPCIYDWIGSVGEDGKASAMLNGKSVIIDVNDFREKAKEEYNRK